MAAVYTFTLTANHAAMAMYAVGVGACGLAGVAYGAYEGVRQDEGRAWTAETAVGRWTRRTGEFLTPVARGMLGGVAAGLTWPVWVPCVGILLLKDTAVACARRWGSQSAVEAPRQDRESME